MFRMDQGRLLEKPYSIAIVTSAAVNANVVHQHLSSLADSRVHETMLERCRRVLAVAALHKQQNLVLGAFGFVGFFFVFNLMVRF